jgi:hypothetical protein
MESYVYQAYLLRLWREGENATWRASLEDPRTGSRRSFATLEKLLTFLNEASQTPDTAETAARAQEKQARSGA